jgi:hypothetical protein
MNLMKNKFIQKFQSFLNFERKGCKENDFFKKPFDKTNCVQWVHYV